LKGTIIYFFVFRIFFLTGFLTARLGAAFVFFCPAITSCKDSTLSSSSSNVIISTSLLLLLNSSNEYFCLSDKESKLPMRTTHLELNDSKSFSDFLFNESNSF